MAAKEREDRAREEEANNEIQRMRDSQVRASALAQKETEAAHSKGHEKLNDRLRKKKEAKERLLREQEAKAMLDLEKRQQEETIKVHSVLT